MRKLLVAALFTVGWGMLAAAPAVAGGNSSTPCAPVPQASTCTYTQNLHGVVQTFPSNVPCVDPPNSITGMLTITYNSVSHVTVNTAGDAWFTTTQTGTFSFAPFDPNGLSYSGHFAFWFGASFNQNNTVFHDTGDIHGTASDGTALSFHMVDHANLSSTGVVTLSFSKVSC